MDIFFSASTLGFYPEGSKPLYEANNSWPDDALLLSVETYEQVRLQIELGGILDKGTNGEPIVVMPNPETEASALSNAYAQKRFEIEKACENAITGGFWSKALGESHLYGSSFDDQLGLTGAILTDADSVYSCRDEQGVKEFRLHTVTQLRQVGRDFTDFKLQLQQRADGLKQQLDQALSVGDLTALLGISWEGIQ